MSKTRMRPDPPAVISASASAFMAKLFDAQSDAEILDPDLTRIEQEVAREALARVGREWRSRMAGVNLAFHRMRVAQGERCEARCGPRDPETALSLPATRMRTESVAGKRKKRGAEFKAKVALVACPH